MKNKIIYNSALVVILLLFSCETTNLDLQLDPNKVTIENADPRLLLNNLPQHYFDFINKMGDASSRLTRIMPMTDRILEDEGIYAKIFDVIKDLENTGNNRSLHDAWIDFYAKSLPEMELIESIASKTEDNFYDFHIAIVRIFKAHMASVLVDYYGDIIFSEATNLAEFKNPKLDNQEDVYASCIDLLNQAITILKTSPSDKKLDDRFYDGDATKWINLANSLKLRMYKNTGNTSAFNAIIASGEFLSDSSDDLVIDDIRSFRYTRDYSGQDERDVKSNWLMQTMADFDDPRLRYYFYRQTDVSLGEEVSGDESVLPCSIVTPLLITLVFLTV